MGGTDGDVGAADAAGGGGEGGMSESWRPARTIGIYTRRSGTGTLIEGYLDVYETNGTGAYIWVVVRRDADRRGNRGSGDRALHRYPLGCRRERWWLHRPTSRLWLRRVTNGTSRLRRVLAQLGWWDALRSRGTDRLLALNSFVDAAGTGLAAICLPFYALLVPRSARETSRRCSPRITPPAVQRADGGLEAADRSLRQRRRARAERKRTTLSRPAQWRRGRDRRRVGRRPARSAPRGVRRSKYASIAS